MANLYELMGDFEALQRALDSESLTDEELSAVLDALDETKGTLRSKIDGIARLLANLDSDIGRFKHEEQRLAARRKAMENKKERLRGWVRTSMDILDVTKVKTDLHSVTISEGKPKVVVVDEGAVPDDYVRLKREVDKAAVMKAFTEDGEIVKGCDIIKGEPTLRIR